MGINMNVDRNDTLKGMRPARSQNSNQRNVQGKGADLYEKFGNRVTEDSRRTIEQSRLSTYDIYCSMRAEGRSQIFQTGSGVQESEDFNSTEPSTDKQSLEDKETDLELTTTEEEIADQESGTKTDIIVKPDGSRVLVVTMTIGGMETTMSLEISKPTDMINDVAKEVAEEEDKQSAISGHNLSENLSIRVE